MILITKIAQPEVGAVMAQYCEVCKTTTFMVHELAKRPDDGDYWLLTMPCSTHPSKFTCELDKVQLSADLDRIADKVLAYRPKPKTKAAKRRKRRDQYAKRRRSESSI